MNEEISFPHKLLRKFGVSKKLNQKGGDDAEVSKDSELSDTGTAEEGKPEKTSDTGEESPVSAEEEGKENPAEDTGVSETSETSTKEKPVEAEVHKDSDIEVTEEETLQEEDKSIEEVPEQEEPADKVQEGSVTEEIQTIRMEDDKIITQLDKMYKILKGRESAELEELVNHFGVSKEIIKEWGRILEEHDLISVRYTVSGKIEFKIKKK